MSTLQSKGLTPDDNRPWIRADWRYVYDLPSISVGSPDAGKHEKQALDASKAMARWSKANELDFIGPRLRDFRESQVLADNAIAPDASDDATVGKSILKLARLSARAMQRRALRRGITLSDSATEDAAGDATLAGWRFWCAVRSARRQPLFTPPTGAQAQWWQWVQRIKRHIRKSVSRSFSGRGFGTVQDCGSSLESMEFDSLDSFSDYWASAPNPINKRSDCDTDRKLSDALAIWPAKALELASKVLQGGRLSDQDLSYIRVTLHRKGLGWLIKTTDKDTKQHRLYARVRVNSFARLAIRPISKFKRLSVGQVGKLPVKFMPPTPVWHPEYAHLTVTAPVMPQ